MLIIKFGLLSREAGLVKLALGQVIQMTKAKGPGLGRHAGKLPGHRRAPRSRPDAPLLHPSRPMDLSYPLFEKLGSSDHWRPRCEANSDPDKCKMATLTGTGRPVAAAHAWCSDGPP